MDKGIYRDVSCGCSWRLFVWSECMMLGYGLNSFGGEIMSWVGVVV